MIAGLIFSIIAMILSPSLINFAILCLYLVEVWLLNKLNATQRDWGYAFDEANNNRISGASVRIFDIQQRRQLDIQITDDKGRFGFNLKDGDYYMTLTADGYDLSKTLEKDAIISPTGQTFIKIKIVKGQVKTAISMHKRLISTKFGM